MNFESFAPEVNGLMSTDDERRQIYDIKFRDQQGGDIVNWVGDASHLSPLNLIEGKFAMSRLETCKAPSSYEPPTGPSDQ